jgi:hypothetical protein
MTSTFARVSRTARAPMSVAGAIGLSLALLGSVLLALLGSVPPARANSCPNEGFRTGPGANLPDCRAYEMVSPPEKNGGEVDGGPVLEGTPPAPQQAALNGAAVTYGSQTTFTEAGPSSSLLSGQYLSRREPGGWHTQAITPEQDMPGGVFDSNGGSVEFSLLMGFTEDLSHAFLLANEPAPVAGAPAHYFNPYVRDNLDGGYRLLSTTKPPVQSPGFADTGSGFRIEYAGMSADGSHVVFTANDALTPEALPGAENLYESTNGHLELISALPGGPGAEAVPGAVFGRPAFDQGGLNEGYNRVISAAGSRVIWSDSEGVYVSELTADGARIVHGPLPGVYETASGDDGVVFTNTGDLNRYEVSTGKSSDLTGSSANVVEVLGASEDGSYVYFLATGALAGGASQTLYNIYLWHDGQISFIASTSGEDYGFREGSNGNYAGAFNGGQKLLESAAMRVSPDGRYLAFESSEALTEYDNMPAKAGACESVTSFWAETVRTNPSGRCVEVYEYDASAARLTCVSCNPRSLPPAGDSVLPMPVHALVQNAGWQTTTVQQRYLLDNGRLFFDSADAVLPQASNGKLNVYEYEPQGVSTCQRGGGCIALISSGTSNENSFFIDASASGDDVFITTRQQLVAQDGDEAMDLYDARVDGGFSAAAPPPCGGEACRPPVASAPAIYGAPASATFAGAGTQPAPAAQLAAGKPSQKHRAKRKPRRRHRAKRKKAKGGAHGSRPRRSSEGSHR